MTAPVAQRVPSPGASTQERRIREPIPVEVGPPATDSISLARRVLEPDPCPFESALIIFIVAVFILLQETSATNSSRPARRSAPHDGGDSTPPIVLADTSSRNSALTPCLASLGGLHPCCGGVVSDFAFRPLHRPNHRRSPAGDACCCRKPALVDGGLDARPLRCRRIDHGAVHRAYGLWHSMGLSPVAVVIAAIFWSWWWGPLGLIMSTPLTLCLVVLGPARRPSGVPRRTAWGSTSADADRKLLPTHASRRPG